MSKWKFRPDQLDQFQTSGHELIALHVPDALDKKGRSIGKAPYKGWRKDRPLTFEEAVDHMEGEANIGVRMRPCDLVIDVDPRNFEEGDDPVKRLEEDLEITFSDYPTVVTGSGGLHIYMLKPEHEILRDTLEAYQGIEFKALGRQVVAPGSVHPDTKKPYLWDGDALAVGLDGLREAPKALIEIARRPGRTTSVDAGKYSAEQLGDMLEGIDPLDYKDHQKWLDMMMACHHATAGEGRDEFLEWSTSDPQYAKDAWLIGRRWDSLHADMVGVRVTERTLYKALHAAGKAELIPRASAQEDFAPSGNFDELDPDADDVELQAMIDTLPDDECLSDAREALNARGYAAVNDNGTFRVYRQTWDWEWPDNPRLHWEVQKKGDFIDILSNVRIQTTDGDKTKIVPLATEWLKWGGRTSYNGVVFDPGHKVPKKAKMLNLWSDWAVEPKKGDWSYLKQLVKEGLCSDDETAYEYMLNWAAYMVQHPDSPAEVALIVKGQKGTGKGTFFRALNTMAGRHGMHVSHQHHFTNHFNSHLRDCIFLFVDEAMWAGDKKSEGELKRLITEPTIMFEGKGKDAIMGRNHLHVGIASNEDWVVPASMEDERRFAIFDASSKFRGDTKFFTSLYDQLDNGGLQAMLWDLKARDISDFHPRRNIPQTKALAEQKLHSLDPMDAWWYDCLCTGDVTDENGELKYSWDVDPLDDEAEPFCLVASEDVKDSMDTFLKRIGDRYYGRKSMDSSLGKHLARQVDGIRKVRTKPPEHRTDLKVFGDQRCYAYLLPPLEICRAAFEKKIGTPLDWDQNVSVFQTDTKNLNDDVQILD